MSASRWILRRVRKLVNWAGLDIVRYDSGASRPDFGSKRASKPHAPGRIIIGGGDVAYGPNWHNIEYVTEGYEDKYKNLPQNIDIPHDLTSGRPFPINDGSIAAAYSSHVVEHLKDDHVRFILRDTVRVLKPGGVLRVSCPNIDLYVRAFLERDLGFFHYRDHPHYRGLGINESVTGLFLDVFATQVGERPQPFTYEEVRSAVENMGVEKALNHFCEQVEYDYSKSHYHVNWFDPTKLISMFKEAGFGEVYLSALGQSYSPDMRDLQVFDMGDPKISMFVEGRK